MAFKNYANMIDSFVDNLFKKSTSETTDDDCFETSTASEHCNSIADRVIELNHAQNELISIETRLMDCDNMNRLKNCQLLTEKEANILISLNTKLLFLNEEVQRIKLALFSFKHEKALLIPMEAQKDFFKTVDVLSDFNNNLEKALESLSGSSDESLKNFIEVFGKELLEMKQAMCILSKTYNEIKTGKITIENKI